MENNIPHFLTLDQIRPGDVLLCRRAAKSEQEIEIVKTSRSEYTHAAICIGDGKAAGAGLEQGIQIHSVRLLMRVFDHIAVLRQPDAWSPERMKALADFAAAAAAAEAGYNDDGLNKFLEIRLAHESTVHERLMQFFDGKHKPPMPTAVGRYTCSEFVVAGFIIVGFIDPSAAILYSPGAFAPGDLGEDPTFGTFAGYLPLKAGYEIPATDRFYNETTYAKIFEDE
jgi:hypothetical protein